MANNKKQNFWRELWGLLSFTRKRIKGLFVVIFVVELMALIGPYILKLVIDNISTWQTEKLQETLLLAALFFVSEQSVSLVHYFKDRQTFKVLMDTEYFLPTFAQEKLVNLSLSYHEKEDTGNKIVKVERGLNKIVELLVSIFWEVLPTLVQMVFTLAVLFVVDWRIGLSFLFFAPVFVLITFLANKRLHPVRKIRHREYERASGKMGQSIININAVQSFVQERREIREYAQLKDKIRKKELWEWLTLLRFGISRNLMIDLGRAAVLIIGVYLISRGAISIGSLVFVITLSEKSYFSLYRLSRFYDKVAESSEAVKRFVDIIQTDSEIKNKKSGLRPKDIKGNLSFQNASFAYERENNGKAVDNLNFEIVAGTTTALVGPSGGGKTTVVKLIYRHYDPQSGQVLLDGHNLKDYDVHAFRKFISIVPQEVEIFNLSIRDNIAYARPEASQADIVKAAEIANALEFIEKLPEKYDTLVGERGMKLSGGQRQRIGIARAILANPRILIFDEATSNLDSYSEKLIQEAMDRVSMNRTVILIAHRLSTIKKADKIIVLEHGQVVEEGSHHELSQINGGLYAKLLSLQALGEVD